MAEPSSVAAALPRLRHVREEHIWEPLTPASTVHQRAARVEEARQKVVFHPLPPERMSHWDRVPRRLSWHWLPYAILAVLCLGTYGWDWIFQPSSVPSTFPVNDSPPPITAGTLTESVALQRAVEALVAQGLSLAQWRPVSQSNGVLGADGKREQYLYRPTMDLSRGEVTFQNAMGNQRVVSIKLAPDGTVSEITWRITWSK